MLRDREGTVCLSTRNWSSHGLPDLFNTGHGTHAAGLAEGAAHDQEHSSVPSIGQGTGNDGLEGLEATAAQLRYGRDRRLEEVRPVHTVCKLLARQSKFLIKTR